MSSSKTPRMARVAVQQSFKTYVATTTVLKTLPIAWRNKDVIPTNGAPYMRFTFQHTAGNLAALGQQLFRRSVLITVQLFMAEGQGEEAMDTAGEELLEWFEKFNVAGFNMRDPSPSLNEIGNFGGYYQANVSLGADYDAFRT